jgi:hypothetical protein
MVRYYGYYSNVSRGKRQKEGSDDFIPCILEPQGNEKAFRKSWARLIRKIYEVDPLVCPKCKGAMRIISSIEDPSVIRSILAHLGLWLTRARPPPKAHAPPGGHDGVVPHTPMTISSFKHTLIRSTATPITPGINTSSHNAS